MFWHTKHLGKCIIIYSSRAGIFASSLPHSRRFLFSMCSSISLKVSDQRFNSRRKNRSRSAEERNSETTHPLLSGLNLFVCVCQIPGNPNPNLYFVLLSIFYTRWRYLQNSQGRENSNTTNCGSLCSPQFKLRYF